MKKTVKQFSVVLAVMMILLSSCTNMKGVTSRATNTLTNPAFTSSSTVYSHTVQNVSIALLTSGSPPDMKLSLAVTAGSLPLTSYCEVGNSTAKPCGCLLTWTEVNTVGGSSTSVSRTKKLAVTDVQNTVVKCQMTQAFWNEVAAGTPMHMNIIPMSTNSTGLSVQQVGYKKGTSVAPAGDFVDDTLTPFRNIYRYTCFSKRTSSYEVLNSFTEGEVPTGPTTTQKVNILLASRLCTEAGTDCQTPRNGYSAQSYYRNLFIRSDKLGEINSTNARYDCPKVFESLSYSATTPPTVPAAEQSRYWPLDTTFAVATTATSEWSVPIPAASVLKKSGDVSAISDPTINTSDRLKELDGDNAGIAWKMMGYGKKPNANGTCGSIVDSNGRNRPLTRLRRYRVVYPATYLNSGQVDQDRPEADQVYVADRLVADVSGNLTGNMIYGPKPCNFSWFDHEGVTGDKLNPAFPNRRTGMAGIDFQTNFTGSFNTALNPASSVPNYRATSEFYYDNGTVNLNVNPDGKALPNIDRAGAVGGLIAPSCSATVSLYDTDPTGVLSKTRLVTSYKNRTDKITMGTRDLYLSEIAVNPVERWSPDYVEDTSFQACVPIADPYLESPLHFYRDSAVNGGSVSWCAKVYPTQNPYWLELNSRKKPLATAISSKAVNWNSIAPQTQTALVKWYTSHAKGLSVTGLDGLTNGVTPVNSCSSTATSKICEFSLGVTAGADYNNCVTYLSNGATADTNRCDRTVMYDSNQDYRGFPLLASDSDIRSMLSSDISKSKTYSCNFSVHSNPNKVNKDQPISNCCGVRAGSPLLGIGFLPYSTAANDGHMEPYTNPVVPNIRFCGNPVE